MKENKIIRFNLELHPDACTMEEALESGLGIYDADNLPPGTELSDFLGYDEEPADVIPFPSRKPL